MKFLAIITLTSKPTQLTAQLQWVTGLFL